MKGESNRLMVKEALRARRRLSRQRGRNRSPRPKTFVSEESAKNWAQKQGYTDFKLENLKTEASTVKKFRVIVEV